MVPGTSPMPFKKQKNADSALPCRQNSGTLMSNPLKMKKMGSQVAGQNVVEEDLSEVDEEEEKKMAMAYTEVNRSSVYAAGAGETEPAAAVRNNTIFKGKKKKKK